MGDKEYLLTFNMMGKGHCFEWFDTEEEMLERVSMLVFEGVTTDIEALHVRIIEKII